MEKSQNNEVLHSLVGYAWFALLQDTNCYLPKRTS